MALRKRSDRLRVTGEKENCEEEGGKSLGGLITLCTQVLKQRENNNYECLDGSQRMRGMNKLRAQHTRGNAPFSSGWRSAFGWMKGTRQGLFLAEGAHQLLLCWQLDPKTTNAVRLAQTHTAQTHTAPTHTTQTHTDLRLDWAANILTVKGTRCIFHPVSSLKRVSKSVRGKKETS